MRLRKRAWLYELRVTKDHAGAPYTLLLRHRPDRSERLTPVGRWAPYEPLDILPRSALPGTSVRFSA